MEWDNPERPECTNLLTIYSAVTGKSKEEVCPRPEPLRSTSPSPLPTGRQGAVQGFAFILNPAGGGVLPPLGDIP